jgi:tripartite motif-containing protein 71
MASNRFDFLEFSQDPDENGQPDADLPFGPAHLKDAEPPAHAAGSASTVPPPTARPPRAEATIVHPSTDKPQQAPSLTLKTQQEKATPKPDSFVLRAEEVFGTRGSAAGQFNFPAGVAVDRTGILFVADVYNHRLQRITPDGSVAIVGSRGSGRTKFLAPTGVAVDADRAFYVVEQGNHRVQKFSSEGVLELVFGRMGSKPGEFRSPMGICISIATGEILVADTGNGRVQRFSMGGEYVGSLGGPGSVQPPLANPQSVAVDHIGNIFVADTLGNRVARYDPIGRFTGHFGGVIRAQSNFAPNVRFTEPHAIAASTAGDLFIADGDQGPGRLVVMNSDTGAVRTVVEDAGRGLGKLQRPGGITVSTAPRSGYADGLGRLDVYVSDTVNHRIIRFSAA